MEYKFSEVLSPTQYRTDGLCEGIPVRKHRAADLEEIGTFRAQEDWSKLVEPLSVFKGGLGPSHNFMALSLPECLPERFEIVCYANEFAFLHDDESDVNTQSISNAKNIELLEGFRVGIEKDHIDVTASGKRQLQAKILTKMLQLDRKRALVAMKAWAEFLEQGPGLQHHSTFATLEEYLPYRCTDVGHMFWNALVTFGCALDIPEDEEEICKELVLPAVIAASLTNDLYSYNKELQSAQKAGLTGVTNSLWYLMIEHRITLDEAKSRCRDRIQKEVATYVQTVEMVKQRSDLSSDTKRYLELMQYSVSGNVVWSIQCPRYNDGARYNERQQFRMTYGVDSYPTTYHLPAAHEGAISAIDEPLTEDVSRSGDSSNISGVMIDDVPFLSDLSCTSVMYANRWNAEEITECKQLPGLSDVVVMEPTKYIQSLPSKGIRDKLIKALNFWLKVPSQSEATIRSVISMLHTSSLMLDDIQDGSQLRRGQSSAHVIFGEGQTITAATFQYIEAVATLQKLNNPRCLDIFIDEVRSMFVGQSYDLAWIWERKCPTVQEYLQMVDGKTGGLFRLLARLMAAESSSPIGADLDLWCHHLGRYYQIRDDYQNLVSEEYANQKGMCEDLDEGKYSLPLIHALSCTEKAHTLHGLLSRRHIAGGLTGEQKRLVLRLMREAGSLEYTLTVLRTLFVELKAETSRLGAAFGQTNHELQLILEMLRV